MSRTWQFIIGVVAILVVRLPARAQTPPITIDDVRVGYSADADADDPDSGNRHRITNYLKSGFWTPVYVAITPGPEGIKSGRVVVETDDCDDVRNTYSTPLPSGGLPPNESYTAVTYVKIGSLTSELVIRVEADDRSRETKYSPNAIMADDLLYVGIGSRLSGLKRTVYNESQASQQVGPRAYVGVVDREVRELPDRWFGYDTIDLAILCTSRRDFVTDLLNEREHRKEALAEWVRRGGRLVISCGHNQDMLNELLSRFQFDLPVSSSTPLHVDTVTGLQGWLRSSAVFPARDYSSSTKAAPVELAKLDIKPGHQELEILAPERSDDKSPPLVVRCPYGLGQIILVAFDLDSGAFASWKGQQEFWKKLQSVTSTHPKSYDSVRSGRLRYNPYQQVEDNTDLVSSLYAQLEQFPNVSVVPFGWVAVFILIYIIIVGPIDYLFLKKVVKRLELTWITFPTVVIAVSVSAYYAAYYLKGSDLRINKVDLVDLDMEGHHSYGTTWFSLFSPRIQLYTIGIEPVPLAPVDPGSKIEPSTVVSWLGRPEGSFGGVNRPRSQGIFSRKYEFDTDARALRNVPIQVWTSKSFTASWDQPLPPGRRPIRSTLQHRESGTGLEGSIMNDLPFPLSDVAIIVKEGGAGGSMTVFTMDRLEPGQTGTIERGVGTARLGDWITRGADSASTIRQIMFHDAGQADQSNRLYRGLAQAWRPAHFDTAMLVASVPVSEGPAESINGGSKALSRLWLGEAPAPGAERPALMGNLSQKTYVRAFLPLGKSSEGATRETKP
jgi:hypothetical protein